MRTLIISSLRYRFCVQILDNRPYSHSIYMDNVLNGPCPVLHVGDFQSYDVPFRGAENLEKRGVEAEGEVVFIEWRFKDCSKVFVLLLLGLLGKNLLDANV